MKRPSGLLAGGIAIVLGSAIAFSLIWRVQSQSTPLDRPMISNFNQQR